MIAVLLSSLATFFVVIDPLGAAPIFVGLTGLATPVERRALAVRSVVIAALVLFPFALLGEQLLHALGISLDAFRIAGGITLFLVALEMIFGRNTHRREEELREADTSGGQQDISVFPMAIPMIAGPGSIASAMLLMSRGPGWGQRFVVLAALAIVLILVLILLLVAEPLMRLAGKKVEMTLTRVLGVLLSALAVQFVMDGVRAAFG